jgi:hypothetical protein
MRLLLVIGVGLALLLTFLLLFKVRGLVVLKQLD